jgi:hypothetical protein
MAPGEGIEVAVSPSLTLRVTILLGQALTYEDGFVLGSMPPRFGKCKGRRALTGLDDGFPVSWEKSNIEDLK